MCRKLGKSGIRTKCISVTKSSYVTNQPVNRKVKGGWERQIKKLMNDFCIPQEKQTEIISDVKGKYSGDDYAMYNHCWDKFKEYISVA